MSIPFREFEPTTAAVTTNQIPSSRYASITVSCEGLAGAETVTLQFMAGDTPKQVTDIYGTVINLTATVSGVRLAGGPNYIFTKSITAAPCSIYVNPEEK